MAFAGAWLIGVVAALSATTGVDTASKDTRPLVMEVAAGCGPGAWRGPWGGCRDTPYSGPLPGGGWQNGGNACPPGFWRGPWGHCRDTPYSGALPGGGWQGGGNGCPPGYWRGPWGHCRDTPYTGPLPGGG